MLSYIPTEKGDMGGESWLWLDFFGESTSANARFEHGDRVMFMDQENGVTLPEAVVCRLAAQVLEYPPIAV